MSGLTVAELFKISLESKRKSDYWKDQRKNFLAEIFQEQSELSHRVAISQQKMNTIPGETVVTVIFNDKTQVLMDENYIVTFSSHPVFFPGEKLMLQTNLEMLCKVLEVSPGETVGVNFESIRN